MDVKDLLAELNGKLGGKLVFGEPVERDGALVIPAASVRAGGGLGRAEKGGFGVKARPRGAFVVKDGKVSWVPAVDVNLIVAGGQALGLAVALVVWSVLSRRSRR